MVLGGAPNAKLAPMGDIYFSFGFSTQFGYLLTTSAGVQTTSNSYGDVDARQRRDGRGSQEADMINTHVRQLRPRRSSRPATALRASARSPRRRRSTGIQVGASTKFGSTGWDSIANYSQVTDNDVIEWSNRGPGANGRNGVDVVADGAYAPGDATLNTVVDGQNAWDDVGRHQPLDAGHRRRGGADPAGLQGGARLVRRLEPTVQDDPASPRPNDLGYDSFDAGRRLGRRRRGGRGRRRHGRRPSRRTSGGRRLPRHGLPALPRRRSRPGSRPSQTFDARRPRRAGRSPTGCCTQYASDPMTFTSQPLAQESARRTSTRPTT